MKAAVLKARGENLVIEQTAMPEPASGEVLIRLKAAGLNHRDLWIQRGSYNNLQYPVILGSDGSGIVQELGKDVDSRWLGREVLINPSLNWGQRRQGQGKNWQILGMPSWGTFAEYICVNAENVFSIPRGLSWQQAAALPLGGITAYRALFYRGEAQQGQSVLITGAGGGVATLLIQFAVAAGLKTYVTSSSDQKIQKALELKAIKGARYDKNGWHKELLTAEPEGFDLIIDSAGGENFPLLLELVKTGGRIVTFGGTAGKIPAIVPRSIFWKQISILGSTMGSPVDFIQMLALVTENHISPVIDREFAFDDIQGAFAYMGQQKQFGKIILNF